MAKERGVARKVKKIKAVDLEISYGKRSDASDEAARLAVLDWMNQTQVYHANYQKKISEEVAREEERRKKIEQAKASRRKDHNKVLERRNRLNSRNNQQELSRNSFIPNDIRCYGNAQGVGASYRMETRTVITNEGTKDEKVLQRIE